MPLFKVDSNTPIYVLCSKFGQAADLWREKIAKRTGGKVKDVREPDVIELVAKFVLIEADDSAKQEVRKKTE